MKIQIAFLALFLATAHARLNHPQHKSLRESDNHHYTPVPKGSSVAFECDSKGHKHCCVEGDFRNFSGLKSSHFGGGKCEGRSMRNGKFLQCKSESCHVVCDGKCQVAVGVVKVPDGSGGSAPRGGVSHYGNTGRGRHGRDYDESFQSGNERIMSLSRDHNITDAAPVRSVGRSGGYHDDGSFNHRKSHSAAPPEQEDGPESGNTITRSDRNVSGGDYDGPDHRKSNSPPYWMDTFGK